MGTEQNGRAKLGSPGREVTHAATWTGTSHRADDDRRITSLSGTGIGQSEDDQKRSLSHKSMGFSSGWRKWLRRASRRGGLRRSLWSSGCQRPREPRRAPACPSRIGGVNDAGQGSPLARCVFRFTMAPCRTASTISRWHEPGRRCAGCCARRDPASPASNGDTRG